MFKLVISDDEGKTTVVPLVRDEVTIGRKEGNTIRLTERNVSRRHAKLLKSNGAFLVEDLNSYNGVKLNGRKIEGRVSLKAGDQLGIGDYMLALQVEGAVDVADASTAAIATQGLPDAQTAMIAAPAEPRPPARLVMLTPPAPGAEFALSRERQRIGRAEDLPIWVNHRSISREHAEIVRDAEGFKLVDLGSANGVRLNGKDVESSPLQPGDVVELGQVRFRFVGEGETYVFDSDATVQMEAVSGPAPTSRAPVFAAVGIILAAVIVAAVVAIGGGDETDETPTIAPIDPTNTQPSETASALDDGRLDRAIRDCRAALEGGQLDAAIGFATTALELSPGNTQAEACKTMAEARQTEQATFEAGLMEFNRGNYEDAALRFGSLSQDNPLRNRPEVVHTFEELLRMAEELIATDPERAGQIAQQVQTTPGVPAALRGRAESIARRAAEAPPPQVAVVEPVRNNNPRDRGTTMRQRDRDTSPMETTQVQRATMEQASGGGGNPMTECLSENNYNACLIQRLRTPRTPREFAALATAYNERGDRARGCDYIRTLVQRYPTSTEARRMGQIMARQCQ